MTLSDNNFVEMTSTLDAQMLQQNAGVSAAVSRRRPFAERNFVKLNVFHEQKSITKFCERFERQQTVPCTA